MERAATAFRAGLARWVDFARRHARAVLAISVLATLAGGWYAATTLAIDTSTTDMLSPELPFRRDARELSQAFPQLSNQIVVVIDGATSDAAENAAERLSGALRGQSALFRSVFYAEGDPFFRRNGFLYLDTDELSALIDRLAGAQAFLGKLWRDPSLRGLFDILALAVENTGDAAPPGELGRVLDEVAAAVEAQNRGQPGAVSWRTILEGKAGNAADRRRIVVVQPVLDYGSLAPAGPAIDAIRTTASALGLTPANGVTVRLTGSAPLEEEELETVMEGMGLANAVSLALVIGLLFWGLKSSRLGLATITTLLFGLVWTAAFAAVAIGRLNLISVAFAVLFIGLSVDFGIHFALRARESLANGDGPAQAMRDAASSVGPALTLCAVAAAISFYSFLPTEYRGLAELGLIAGTSMFIALFSNLTVLPAMITLMGPKVSAATAAGRRGAPEDGRNMPFVLRHARTVAAGALALGIAAIALAPRASFDFDPLNLRDPDTESMRTLFDLMEDGESGPYSIDLLAPSLEQAESLAARLEKLPEVDNTITLADYIPKDQETKLAAIEQAALFLLPAFQGEPGPAPSDTERVAAIDGLRKALVHRLENENNGGTLSAAMKRLDSALAAFRPTASALAELERRLVGTLRPQLADLRTALEAGPVTAAELPDALKSRMLASDGRARIEVEPKADLRDRDALERFVSAVRSVAPHATGSPVVIVEAGRAVIRAFLEAGAMSVIAIAILVAVLLRRLRDVALVFAPLLLAGVLTVAAAVILRMPFNFANVIVLPLLFGLGVASAIHLMLRARDAADLGELLATSTPRAVTFSALTTIVSFGSLALSSHPGTASMGILLTIAISMTLLTTLFVLPALMATSGVVAMPGRR